MNSTHTLELRLDELSENEVYQLIKALEAFDKHKHHGSVFDALSFLRQKSSDSYDAFLRREGPGGIYP